MINEIDYELDEIREEIDKASRSFVKSLSIKEYNYLHKLIHFMYPIPHNSTDNEEIFTLIDSMLPRYTREPYGDVIIHTKANENGIHFNIEMIDQRENVNDDYSKSNSYSIRINQLRICNAPRFFSRGDTLLYWLFNKNISLRNLGNHINNFKHLKTLQIKYDRRPEAMKPYFESYNHYNQHNRSYRERIIKLSSIEETKSTDEFRIKLPLLEYLHIFIEQDYILRLEENSYPNLKLLFISNMPVNFYKITRSRLKLKLPNVEKVYLSYLSINYGRGGGLLEYSLETRNYAVFEQHIIYFLQIPSIQTLVVDNLPPDFKLDLNKYKNKFKKSGLTKLVLSGLNIYHHQNRRRRKKKKIKQKIQFRGFHNLIKLRTFHLINFEMDSLDSDIVKCKNIEELNISNNQFYEIPPLITEMKKLVRFGYDNNYITTLPKFLLDVPNLIDDYLRVVGNKINSFNNALLQKYRSIDIDCKLDNKFIEKLKATLRLLDRGSDYHIKTKNFNYGKNITSEVDYSDTVLYKSYFDFQR